MYVFVVNFRYMLDRGAVFSCTAIVTVGVKTALACILRTSMRVCGLNDQMILFFRLSSANERGLLVTVAASVLEANECNSICYIRSDGFLGFGQSY